MGTKYVIVNEHKDVFYTYKLNQPFTSKQDEAMLFDNRIVAESVMSELVTPFFSDFKVVPIKPV